MWDSWGRGDLDVMESMGVNTLLDSLLEFWAEVPGEGLRKLASVRKHDASDNTFGCQSSLGSPNRALLPRPRSVFSDGPRLLQAPNVRERLAALAVAPFGFMGGVLPI